MNDECYNDVIEILAQVTLRMTDNMNDNMIDKYSSKNIFYQTDLWKVK